MAFPVTEEEAPQGDISPTPITGLHLKGLVCKEDGPETRIPETACWKISRRTPRSFVWGQLEGGLQ